MKLRRSYAGWRIGIIYHVACQAYYSSGVFITVVFVLSFRLQIESLFISCSSGFVHFKKKYLIEVLLVLVLDLVFF